MSSNQGDMFERCTVVGYGNSGLGALELDQKHALVTVKSTDKFRM
jgi:hypothetical protein